MWLTMMELCICKGYDYSWKEYALNIELNYTNVPQVWQQEHAQLQEACYIKLWSRDTSPYYKTLSANTL